MATIRQLSDANPDGTLLGQSSTDKIGFYGATPVVKTSITDYTTTTLSISTSHYGYGSTQANALNAAVVAIMARGKANGSW
jgi:ABC-type sulfate transport system permease subunit